MTHDTQRQRSNSVPPGGGGGGSPTSVPVTWVRQGLTGASRPLARRALACPDKPSLSTAGRVAEAFPAVAPEGGHLRARVHLLFWGGCCLVCRCLRCCAVPARCLSRGFLGNRSFWERARKSSCVLSGPAPRLHSSRAAGWSAGDAEGVPSAWGQWATFFCTDLVMVWGQPDSPLLAFGNST